MESDVQKYAERKMPLFNLVISIWQHNLSLKNTIGVGFTKSVFTHANGTCDLNASQKETDEIVDRVLELIKAGEPAFKDWYEKAKDLNKEADELLALYEDQSVQLNPESYEHAQQVFVDNFGYCTILPYWVLFSINKAIEKGEAKESFGKVLGMYEELKGETRYPQLGQAVINKYFKKAAEILNTSPELATCLHPEELGNVIAGKKSVTGSELEKRMNWCAITRAEEPYKVNFIFDQTAFPKLFSSSEIKDITELKGSVAFKGIVRGIVKIVNSIDDMKKFEEGNILVSIQSSPSLMPAIIKCSAIVTDEGGIMCHASIISRELEKPCIIGTKIATKVLKDGMEIELNADEGLITIVR